MSLMISMGGTPDYHEERTRSTSRTDSFFVEMGRVHIIFLKAG
ncbi:hypothetical protein ACIQY5_23505 [Peribacillus frigoritolerans]